MVLHSPIRPPATRIIVSSLFAAILALAAATIVQAQQTPAQTPAQASAQTSTTNSTQSPASAESVTAIASGVVHTSDGFPIPGATLRLVNTDTQKVFVSWTDESGKFEFPALPPGHYTVEASQLGFVAASLRYRTWRRPRAATASVCASRRHSRGACRALWNFRSPRRPPAGRGPRFRHAEWRPASRLKSSKCLRDWCTRHRPRQRRARPAASSRFAERSPRRWLPTDGSHRRGCRWAS